MTFFAKPPSYSPQSAPKPCIRPQRGLWTRAQSSPNLYSEQPASPPPKTLANTGMKSRKESTSSSSSLCQKYLLRSNKCPKDSRDAKRRFAKNAKVSANKAGKRHLSPYVVRGLVETKWMSRSEASLNRTDSFR